MPDVRHDRIPRIVTEDQIKSVDLAERNSEEVRLMDRHEFEERLH